MKRVTRRECLKTAPLGLVSLVAGKSLGADDKRPGRKSPAANASSDAGAHFSSPQPLEVFDVQRIDRRKWWTKQQKGKQGFSMLHGWTLTRIAASSKRFNARGQAQFPSQGGSAAG
jgi:hypothetical protein